MTAVFHELYRAKRLDTREWVYWTSHGKLITTQHGKLVSGKVGLTDWVWELLTDDATQSRSVGMKDKNGKEIFGGDIVRCYHNPKVPDAYRLGTIEWDAEKFRWCFRAQCLCFCLHTILEKKKYDIDTRCAYQVVGNIIDNPELLEV